ncbi:MAG: non-ribosomal peptide synthetase [Gallionellaceae bacterium]
MSELNMNISESVGTCFARVAARLPAKTAIECDGRKASYAELDCAADAIARRLLARDARPPARVALLFNDRIASITAMLGVLKAGDAYVPLDADDPDERMQFILGDCAPIALITDSAHLERAYTLIPWDCRIINIDESESAGMSAPLPEVVPDALAYLFYTSGSTGQPKGVCHSHRNLLYFIGCYIQAMGIREDDRLSLLYSLSFSAANMDIYGGLLKGASVHAYDVRRNGISPLAEWLLREGITILHMVPTVFRHLTGGLNLSHRFDGVRAIDLGGETVFASDVALFRRHFRADCRLTNRLAATEAMVIAQYVVNPHASYEGAQILPIGRSPDGVKLRIQRPDGTEADVGEAGEIVVSSPYVSPGYWQRPELNAAVFSDDPENPGRRIYRTGDMGHIAADGNVHFLGRNGTRIKIRGQSVDLAEVEAGLRQCLSVHDAAVITESHDDQQEADRLVAYVVVGQEADRDPGNIRRELAERLPLHMLPSVYVFLDGLPLTVTGKIDRKSLPRADSLPGDQNGNYQSPTEKLLAGLWKDVLGLEACGVHDDFFASGGNSLSGMQLISKINKIFCVQMPLNSLFYRSTIATQGKEIERLQQEAVMGDENLEQQLREVESLQANDGFHRSNIALD